MQEVCKVKVYLESLMREYPVATSFSEIVKDMAGDQADQVLLVTENGKLRELHKKVSQDCRITLVRRDSKVGKKTYERSLTFLLLRVLSSYGAIGVGETINSRFSVNGGLYFTIKNMKPDQAFLDQVKKDMLALVEKDLPIYKKTIPLEEAIALFEKKKMDSKVRLFKYRRSSYIHVYELDGYEDYFYGYMAASTGYLKKFDLEAYEDGFVLLIPEYREADLVPELSPSPKIFRIQRESEEWGERLGAATVGDINDINCAGDMEQLILVAEALQEGKISSIANEIASRKGVKFVMIAGPSSSGKTTFSHRLSTQLMAHGLKPHPIAVDNYFCNREDTPLDEFGKRDYERLEAIDIELFNQNMTDLLKGEKVEMPRFDFVEGKKVFRGDFLQLGEEDVLVIEGIHCLNDKLSYSLPEENKFRIYISALTQLNIDNHNRIPSTDGRLIRRIVRDHRTRGTSVKNTIAMWSSVRRGEDSYIFPNQEKADVMFNSALIYEFAVLKQYIEPLLLQIEKDCPEYQEAHRLLKFMDYFVGVPSDNIPKNSILREFIGGGCFNL